MKTKVKTKVTDKFKQKRSRSFRGIQSIEREERQTPRASIIRKFADSSEHSVKEPLKSETTFVWCSTDRGQFIGRLDISPGLQRLLLPSGMCWEGAVISYALPDNENLRAWLMKDMGESKMGPEYREYQIERL